MIAKVNREDLITIPQSRYRIIGPHGTGKTTELARQASVAVRAGRNAVVVSFTKAAAEEAAGRHMPVEEDAVGTLHSFAYRALGSPMIADTAKMLKEWNQDHPYDTITGGRDIEHDDLDAKPAGGRGDERLSEMNILRARMIPRDLWRPSLQAFADQWNAWKKANDLLDFTDLIELSLDSVAECPGSPDILFVDEAQDMSAFEMALANKWADTAGGLVTVGDPDQAIYTWRGADPSVFYAADVPEDHERVLTQSHRVPEKVWATSMDWIGRDRTRRLVDYMPRDAEGEVEYSNARWKVPEQLLGALEEDLAAGKTVMILATCSFMLHPTIAVLKRQGLPFHNPYRKESSEWNPLRARRGVSSVDRLLAFTQMVERGEWSRESLARWTEVCRPENVYTDHDGKLWVEVLTDTWVSHDDLHWVLTDQAFGAGMSGDTRWLDQQLLAQKRRGMAYPIEVYKAQGRLALERTPQIVVGTIHSVKGGEADVVYLFPDLSKAGYAEWDGDGRAAVYRLFYVGMTRALEKLVLCSQSGMRSVNF